MSEEQSENEFILFHTELEGEVWFGIMTVYTDEWDPEHAEFKLKEFKLLGMNEAQSKGAEKQPYWEEPKKLGTKGGKTFSSMRVDPNSLKKAKYGYDLHPTVVGFGMNPPVPHFTTSQYVRKSGNQLVIDALDLFERSTSSSS